MPDGQPITGRERRREPRYWINIPALVSSRTEGVAAALVLEASTCGLCLSMPFRLPLNSEVKICFEDRTVLGLTRHCVCKRATEFHVGVEIPDAISIGHGGLDHFRVIQRAKALRLYPAARSAGQL